MVLPGMMGSGAVVTNNGVTKLTSAGMVGATYGPYKGYNTWSGYDIAVELAPHTAVKWTGSYDILSWGKEASAGVLYGTIGEIPTHLVGGTSFLDQKAGNFSFLISNTRDVSRVMTGAVMAWSSGGLNPIPEPSTYALMVAGLGMVGFVARRRKTS